MDIILNCKNPDTRLESYRKFYNVNTLKEFLTLYATFYENQICTPFYYDTFYGNPTGDNKQANYALGQKFKKLTCAGIIVIDSQVTVPYSQKAYIQAFVPNHMIDKLAVELNRHDGIVAFFYDLMQDQEGSWGLYVTYDNDDNDGNFNVATGNPFSHVGKVRAEVLMSLQEWLNPNMKKIINEQNYAQITIIDAMFNSKEDHILDVLLDVVNFITH